jgi:NAD(P)H-dependent FMN reductase
MAANPKILAFAGSTRTDSFNKRLIRIAVAGARSAGAEVTPIDLRDFPLPLFDGDLSPATASLRTDGSSRTCSWRTTGS